MPVEKTMRSYRTTETEKALGKTSKHILIGYLKSVKEVVAEAELIGVEAEKQKKKKKEKAIEKVRAWEAEYQKLISKIIRAELSTNQKSLDTPPAPLMSGFIIPDKPDKTFSISVEDKTHKQEIQKLMKRQPSYDVYREADLVYYHKSNYDMYRVNSELLGNWHSNLGSLIADLESRTSPDVYTAQVMTIRKEVESFLDRFGVTPQAVKAVAREAKNKKK